MLQAAQAERSRAVVEQQRQLEAMKAEGDRQRDAMLAQIQAAKDAKKKDCDDTRPARVSHAKEAIIARLDAEARVVAHAKTIRASCRIVEQRTGAVNVQAGVAGVRVSPELRDDVQCSSLPKGLTKQDAYVILSRVREGGGIAPTGPILQSEDFTQKDVECAEIDRAAGVDFGSVRFEDSASIDNTRRW